MKWKRPSAGMIRIRFCGSRAGALLSARLTGSPLGCEEYGAILA